MGEMLLEKEQILQRWKEYLVDLLSKDSSDDEDKIMYATPEDEIEEHQYEEVEKVIRCLKTYKAPGR